MVKASLVVIFSRWSLWNWRHYPHIHLPTALGLWNWTWIALCAVLGEIQVLKGASLTFSLPDLERLVCIPTTYVSFTPGLFPVISLSPPACSLSLPLPVPSLRACFPNYLCLFLLSVSPLVSLPVSPSDSFPPGLQTRPKPTSLH